MKCNRSSCQNEMNTPRLNIIVWDEIEGAYGGNFCSYPCAIMTVGDAMVYISEGNSLADWGQEGTPEIPNEVLDTLVENFEEGVKLIPNEDPGPFDPLPDDLAVGMLLNEAAEAEDLQFHGDDSEEEEYPEAVIKLISSAEFIDGMLPELFLKLGANTYTSWTSKHTFTCDDQEYEYNGFDFEWKGIAFSVRPSPNPESLLYVFFSGNVYSMNMFQNDKITTTMAAEAIVAHAHSVLALQPKMAVESGGGGF